MRANMKTFAEILSTIIVGLATIALLSVIVAFPIMWLWNWLMPDIFGLKEITVWQAIGLNFLTSALFKQSNNSKSEK